MHIHILSIFPEIFKSFVETSLIAKAQDKKIVQFSIIDPRTFCEDKHQQIDDSVYGGGAGMLLKAKPFIDATESIIKKIKNNNFCIIFPSPSKQIFKQEDAHIWAKYEHLIFVCGRYEGIDYRFTQYMQDKYADKFQTVSLGQFVTLGGEVPTMTMIEATVRLIPGVIKESDSRKHESYCILNDSNNIEAPNYTKPAEIYGYKVPDTLTSGNQKDITQRRKNNSTHI